MFNPDKRLKDSLVSIFNFLKGVKETERRQRQLLLSSAQEKGQEAILKTYTTGDCNDMQKGKKKPTKT